MIWSRVEVLRRRLFYGWHHTAIFTRRPHSTVASPPSPLALYSVTGHLLPPFSKFHHSSLFMFRGLGYTAIFTRRPHSTVASPPSPLALYSVTDDDTIYGILESCKLLPNFRTAISTHTKIIKHGYGMYPTILSMLIKVYIACDNLNLARLLLSEVSCMSLDVGPANLLIDSFMKVGEIDIAKKLFASLPTRDVVTWNSTIGGCVRNRSYLDSINIFKKMLETKIEPDGFTFASVLTACSRLGALDHGKWVHNLMIEKNTKMNYILSSALVDMYSRCGRIEKAKSIFDACRRDHVSLWNAMINGSAMHGLAVDAVSLFKEMEVENISPDAVTFIGILRAFSHSGFVEEGQKYFNLMKNDYSIKPQLEHYGAMVDLFARAGLLDEAHALIEKMSMEPDAVIWRILLSACRTHKNSGLGQKVVEKIRNLGSGDYVLLSNIYCSTKKWDNAETLRRTMRKKGVRKSTGKSWVELHGAIHHFKAGDRSHLESEAIYKVLEVLICRTRMEGYLSSPDLVLMDISEEEKEENLNFHSEKLALAFGILKSGPGTAIPISKNLRTCLDCHSWMKIVSKVLCRVIIVRDRIRFHRFEGGSCSCGDYW